MKYVLFYEIADDASTRARLLFPAHRERFEEFHEQGTLLLGGPFRNAREDGAMAIFTTKIAAERFAAGDPFVREGLVRNWYIREWNEVITES